MNVDQVGSSGDLQPSTVRPRRPGSVTAAAVILISLGTIVGLLGALVLLAGSMFETLVTMPELAPELGDIPPSFGGFIVAVGALVVAWGTVQILAGAFVLGRRSWARVAGLIAATLGALLGVAGVLPGEGSTPAGSVLSLALVAAYVYAFWALIRRRAWFASA